MEINKFIENFETVDLEDDLTIKQLAITINDLIEPYKVNVQEVGLAIAQDNKALIVKLKNKIAKVFKAKRDSYNAMSKKIISVEKAISEPLYLAEEELKEACEKEHNRLIKEQRIALLPMRKAILDNLQISFSDDQLLDVGEVEFNEMIQKIQNDREIEKKELDEKEAWEKATEERLKKQAEEALKKKTEIEELKKKIEEREIRKNTQIQEFLSANGYIEGDGVWKVEHRDNKVFLYKLIAETEIK